jgi:hypothetical protein
MVMVYVGDKYLVNIKKKINSTLYIAPDAKRKKNLIGDNVG